MSHLTQATLSDFVMGQLAPQEARWFETHLESCARCARRLALAARDELLLRAVAREQRCGTTVLGADFKLDPPPQPQAVEATSRWPRWHALAASAALAMGLLALVQVQLAWQPSFPSVSAEPLAGTSGPTDAGAAEPLRLMPNGAVARIDAG